MASKLRNDILIPLEIEPIETRPAGSKLAAIVSSAASRPSSTNLPDDR